MLFDSSKFTKHSSLSKKIIDLVRGMPGKLTQTNIRDRAGVKGEFGASEAVVKRTIRRLLDEGELCISSISKEERKVRGLSPNAREVLELGSAG